MSKNKLSALPPTPRLPRKASGSPRKSRVAAHRHTYTRASSPLGVRDRRDIHWPIEPRALVLTEGDVGFSPPLAAAEHEAYPFNFRYWVGVGPTISLLSGYSFGSTQYPGKIYYGATISLGYEIFASKERRWIWGGRILFPWTKEVSEGTLGYGAGRITRISFLPGLGYFLIPHKLEVTAHLGATLIKGENPEFDTKIAVTPGLSLTWQLSPPQQGGLYQGIELGVFSIAEKRGPTDLGIYSTFCDSIGAAFGSSTPDPYCARGISPTAYVFSLLYKVGGQ